VDWVKSSTSVSHSPLRSGLMVHLTTMKIMTPPRLRVRGRVRTRSSGRPVGPPYKDARPDTRLKLLQLELELTYSGGPRRPSFGLVVCFSAARMPSARTQAGGRDRWQTVGHSCGG
jgi:hypothetical protein